MDESGPKQNRRARRSHVLMAASIETNNVQVPVKLRNLSPEGALIEGDGLPAVDSAAHLACCKVEQWLIRRHAVVGHCDLDRNDRR